MRPYELGKFDFVVDALLYWVSLDGGPDEELPGDVEGFGWYGLMYGGPDLLEAIKRVAEEQGYAPLEEDEEGYFLENAGFIITADSQGFVYVQAYETERELRDAWSELEEEYEDWLRESGEYED